MRNTEMNNYYINIYKPIIQVIQTIHIIFKHIIYNQNNLILFNIK